MNGTQQIETEETEPVLICDECGGETDELHEHLITTGSYPRRTSEVGLCESCSDDVSTCYDCDRSFINDSDMRDIFGNSICERCQESYYTCDDCGCDLHSSDTCSDPDGDGTYCSDCVPREKEKDDRIHDYGYKPSPVFFGTGKLFFGCELEVNCDETEEAVDWVLDALGDNHVYLKEDGSLNSGFEIVSHPHGFVESIELWSKMSATAPMTSHKSGECGFHVHVTREALTRLQIQKIVVFVNAPENAEFIDHIAQRSNNTYCQKKSKKIGYCGHSSDRYEAVNLCNKKTVEFRIFRGNTRPERLLKNIEFVHAVINWVNTVSYRELTHAKFTAYVAKNKKTYQNLQAFIAGKTEGNS